MPEQWYYNDAGEKAGPIDVAELKQLAAEGTIGPDTLVWKTGLKDWVPARQVEGLLPSASGPPPIPSQADAAPRPTRGRASRTRRRPIGGGRGAKPGGMPKLIPIVGGAIALVVLIVIVVGLQGGGGPPSGGSPTRRRAPSPGGQSMPESLRATGMTPEQWLASQKAVTQRRQLTQEFQNYARQTGRSFLGTDPTKLDPALFSEAERPMMERLKRHALELKQEDVAWGGRGTFLGYGQGDLSTAPTGVTPPQAPIGGAGGQPAATALKPYTGLTPDPVRPPQPTTRTVTPSSAEPVASEEARAANVIAENERLAIAALRAYAQAQEKFHERDRYGVGDEMYANPVKGRGFPDLRSMRGRALNLIDEAFARATSPENAWNGYWFVDITHFVDGRPHKWTSTFGLCAVPAEYGKTGVRTVIIDQFPLLRAKDNGGKPVTQFPRAAEGWRAVR